MAVRLKTDRFSILVVSTSRDDYDFLHQRWSLELDTQAIAAIGCGFIKSCCERCMVNCVGEACYKSVFAFHQACLGPPGSTGSCQYGRAQCIISHLYSILGAQCLVASQRLWFLSRRFGAPRTRPLPKPKLGKSKARAELPAYTRLPNALAPALPLSQFLFHVAAYAMLSNRTRSDR